MPVMFGWLLQFANIISKWNKDCACRFAVVPALLGRQHWWWLLLMHVTFGWLLHLSHHFQKMKQRLRLQECASSRTLVLAAAHACNVWLAYTNFFLTLSVNETKTVHAGLLSYLHALERQHRWWISVSKRHRHCTICVAIWFQVAGHKWRWQHYSDWRSIRAVLPGKSAFVTLPL